MAEVKESLPSGPQAGVEYPLTLHYCGNCSMPLEYCEFYPQYEKCKEWLEQHLPEEFDKMTKLNEGSGDGDDDKKRQKRGGKGMMRAKKKEEVEKKVCLSRAPRGKRKSVTVITGLSTFGIDLKMASKYFANKFSCGASVTGNGDEIVVQGDVKDDLFDILPEKWEEIDEDLIDDLGDMKR